MAQDVDVASTCWEASGGRIDVKEAVDLAARDRSARSSPRSEKVRAPGRTRCEIDAKELLAARMERIAARDASFEARDPNLPVLYVVEGELRRFAAAEAVAVDEIEERAVTHVRGRDGCEEPLHLLTREVRERTMSRAAVVRHVATTGDSNAFSHFRLFASGHERKYAQRNKSFRIRVAAGASNMPRRTKHVSSRSKTLIRDSRTDQRRRIRQLFLDRADAYSLAETASIVGISRSTLVREADEDQREAYRVDGAWRFTWRQVAFIALRRWTLAEVFDALGDSASCALPALLSFQEITIQLPQFLVTAVDVDAAANGVTVDEWLRQELTDFAGTVVQKMEAQCPGFRRAYLFPGME